MSRHIKINGLNTPATLGAALSGGTDFIGFVFAPYPGLAIAPPDASQLATMIPQSHNIVGCFRNPDDAELEAILSQVPLDYIQLLGDETPHRAHEIRQVTGLPIIKTVALASAADMDTAITYEQVADYLVFTARPSGSVSGIGAHVSMGADWPFDWLLLDGIRLHRPWFLGGGLTSANIGEALMATGAHHIDITGGVTGADRRQCPTLIAEMLGKLAGISPILAPTQVLE